MSISLSLRYACVKGDVSIEQKTNSVSLLILSMMTILSKSLLSIMDHYQIIIIGSISVPVGQYIL